WHPWLGKNRFLERMLSAKPVRERYRAELERLRTNLFVPERLSERVDELAEIVRPFIAEESLRRLARFERQIGDKSVVTDHNRTRPQAQGFALKHFFVARAESVDQQLNDESSGVIITRGRRR